MDHWYPSRNPDYIPTQSLGDRQAEKRGHRILVLIHSNVSLSISVMETPAVLPVEAIDQARCCDPLGLVFTATDLRFCHRSFYTAGVYGHTTSEWPESSK